MREARADQLTLLNEVRTAFKKGATGVVIQAATGYGKTALMEFIAHQRETMNAKGKVGIIISKIEQIKQYRDTLLSAGVDIENISAVSPHYTPRPEARYQILSSDKVSNELKRDGKVLGLRGQDIELLIVEEAHHVRCDTWELIVSYFSKAWLLGLTATTVRTDSLTLGKIFQEIVYAPTHLELIELGVLAPVDLIRVPRLNQEKAEWVEAERKAGRTVSSDSLLTGSAVEMYKKITPNGKAFVFGASRRHSREIAERFNKSGIKAIHLDGSTDKAVRSRAVRDFRDGKYQVLCNHSLFIEAIDIPTCDTVLICWHGQSIIRYLQMCGRPMRTNPQNPKKRATIIDLSGISHELGHPCEVRDWSLEPSDTQGRIKKAIRKVALTRSCYACNTVYSVSMMACPVCGHVPIVGKDVTEITDVRTELVPLPENKPRPTKVNSSYRFDLMQIRRLPAGEQFEALLAMERRCSYKEGWAAHLVRHTNFCGPKGLPGRM